MSNKRIQKFLLSEEIDPDAVQRSSGNLGNTAIQIVQGSFRWSNSAEDELILKKCVLQLREREAFSLLSSRIDLKIHTGELVAFVGTVGAGKTSILAAILGEMTKVEGQVTVHGSIAYVPQTAWILNATLKQNILFGKELNEKLYDEVIAACALQSDFGRSSEYRSLAIGNTFVFRRYSSARRCNGNWWKGQSKYFSIGFIRVDIT